MVNAMVWRHGVLDVDRGHNFMDSELHPPLTMGETRVFAHRQFCRRYQGGCCRARPCRWTHGCVHCGSLDHGAYNCEALAIKRESDAARAGSVVDMEDL